MTEREAIEASQDALSTLKANMRALQKINKEAGNLKAVSAVMGLRGKLDVWHAEATAEMDRLFPEFSDEIQTRGGGGGR